MLNGPEYVRARRDAKQSSAEIRPYPPRLGILVKNRGRPEILFLGSTGGTRPSADLPDSCVVLRKGIRISGAGTASNALDER
jgi:hypothetical protein